MTVDEGWYTKDEMINELKWSQPCPQQTLMYVLQVQAITRLRLFDKCGALTEEEGPGCRKVLRVCPGHSRPVRAPLDALSIIPKNGFYLALCRSPNDLPRLNVYDSEKEYWVTLREKGTRKEQISHEEKHRSLQASRLLCPYM